MKGKEEGELSYRDITYSPDEFSVVWTWSLYLPLAVMGMLPMVSMLPAGDVSC